MMKVDVLECLTKLTVSDILDTSVFRKQIHLDQILSTLVNQPEYCKRSCTQGVLNSTMELRTQPMNYFCEIFQTTDIRNTFWNYPHME